MDKLPITFSNYHYFYDYRDNTIQQGEYAQFNMISYETQLIKDMPTVYKTNGSLNQSITVACDCIQLCIPVLNYVLAGNEGKFLRMILGLDEQDWDNITLCNATADIVDNYEDIHLRDIKPGENASNILLGTRLIAQYIQLFNIKNEIKKCLMDILNDNFKKTNDVGQTAFNVLEITTVPNDHTIFLIDKYYLDYKSEETLQSFLKNKRTKDDITASIINKLKSVTSRLGVLLNLPEDKSSLWAMIAPFCIVIPYALRASTPGDKEQVHQKTQLYKELLQANASMQSYYRSKSMMIDDFKNHYNNITEALNKITCLESTQKNGQPIDHSILGALKTKHGQVRQNNLGKRQDYSARTVVTVEPYLPIDRLNVPARIITDMYEYHLLPLLQEELDKSKDDPNAELYGYSIDDIHSTNPARREVIHKQMLRLLKENNILERIPLYMGRQPTLHKHSMQAFSVDVSPTNAIQVPPLVCPGFNMDFDGDAAHVEIPLSDHAIRDVMKLMYTTQNIYLAKNGKSTIMPRQDILYGLYMATRNSYQTVGTEAPRTFATYLNVYDAVCKNKVAVWDKVTVNGNTLTAGDAAVIACFADGDVLPRVSGKGGVENGHFYLKEISKKSIGEYIDFILRKDANGVPVYPIGRGDDIPGTFVGTINHLTTLGFKIAQYYPPNVSLVDAVKEIGEVEVTDKDPITGATVVMNKANYDTAIDDFYDRIKVADMYYGIGLDTTDTYQEKFSDEITLLNDTISQNVTKSLNVYGASDNINPHESGYNLMATSGARGDSSNLYQIFKFKGQIQKDSNTSFNAVIEHGYANQLTPFEQFINAYGGRQGQMDKSLKTGDTGYAMRRMWHTTQAYVITNEDCGDTIGTPLNYVFFEDNYPDDKPEEIFAGWLTGHYLVGSNHAITAAEAKSMAKEAKTKFQRGEDTVYSIRSPLTCNNPCCAKCYGIDPSTQRDVVIGTNIGIIAAQSIGEPATQLTMKQFQKGGVATAGSVGSAFDRVNKYIQINDMTKNYASFDPIAHVDGEVHHQSTIVPGRMNVWVGDDTAHMINVSNKMILTDYAKKGTGISRTRGDYDLTELTEVMGLDYAKRYLVAKLYALYAGEEKIKFQHFEIMVQSMVRYLILDTDRTEDIYSNNTLVSRKLLVGQYATQQELLCGSIANTKYVAVFRGVKNIPMSSLDACDEIQMENLGQGIFRATAMHMTDTMQKPINRLLFAKTITTGSTNPKFVEKTVSEF